MAITETTFGPKRYLALKRSISTDQVSDKQMYDEAGKKLGGYIAEHGLTITGPWSVIYFTWDEAAKKTDMAIAFPVEGITEVKDPELSIIDIPSSKAAMDVLHGPYDGLGNVHQGLMKYAGEKDYSHDVPVMAVEEYVVDPMTESDPQKLVTNIYYLHN